MVYNSGTIQVNSGTVTIDSDVDNTGSILFHDGTFTVSSPCTFTNNFYFGSDPSTLEFGNLVLNPGSTTNFSTGDTVTIDGNLTDNTTGGFITTGSNILFSGGNPHTLTTNNTLSVANLTVGANDTLTVSGTGGITTATALLNSGIINAAGASQTFTFTTTASFTNQGTLQATATNSTLQLNVSYLDNTGGTAAASGGGVVSLGNTIINGGVINTTGGILKGSGILQNQSSIINGGIIEATQATQPLDITGAVSFTSDGLLEALDGGVLSLTGNTVSGAGGFVTDATSEIDLHNCVVTTGGGVGGASGLQNDGTAIFNSGTSTVNSNVTNHGVIQVNGGAFTVPAAYTCTQASGATFQSTSSILEFGHLVLQAGSTTTFSPDDWVTIDANLTDNTTGGFITNSANMVFSGAGTHNLATGNTLVLQSLTVDTGGALVVSGSGVVYADALVLPNENPADISMELQTNIPIYYDPNNSANAYLADGTYGEIMPGIVSTPEPASLGFVGMAGILLMRRRARKGR